MNLSQPCCRYQMFLKSLSRICRKLGRLEAAEDFSSAHRSILSCVRHTNNMMLVGMMRNCPLDLSLQGQLLRHGKVYSKMKLGSSILERSLGFQPFQCHLLLFQQSLILCKSEETPADPCSPHLTFESHMR